MGVKISNLEFEKGIQDLQNLVGGRLQDLGFAGERLILVFWLPHQGLVAWMFDLAPQTPSFFHMDPIPKLKGQVKKSPLELFLRAHLVNRHLNSVSWDSAKGRVLTMDFGDGHHLELRLFPHGTNAIAEASGKRVGAHRIQELQPISEWQREDGEPRSWPEIQSAWSKKSPQKSKENRGTTVGERLKKLKKAAEKIEADLQEKLNSPWRKVGELLVQSQKLDVPKELQSYVDREKSVAWNIQNSFQKAKDLRKKLSGSEARLNELKDQIHSLSALPADKILQESQSDKAPKKSLMQAAGAKGRTFTLPSGHQFFVGKNAQDNLQILRRASAWDLWLHLRDYPGSHGVIRRNKNDSISDEALLKAAAFLVEHTFKAKAESHRGDRFDVLVAEVRFVRPIKGDRLGRVTYSSERVFTLQY